MIYSQSQPLYRPPIAIGLVIFAIWILPGAKSGGQELAESEESLVRACQALGLIRLVADGQNLGVEIEIAPRSALERFRGFKRDIRLTRSTSTVGRDHWRFYSSSDSFEILASYGVISFGRISGQNRPFTPVYQCYLREKIPPQRELLVRAETDGNFFAQLRDPIEDTLFRLQQTKDGRFGCLALGPEHSFATSSPSFDAFCRDHPEFTNARLRPMLNTLGLGQPVTRFDRMVGDFVLDQLTPPDESEIAAFRQLVDGLNDVEFENRQLATESIEDQFDRWQRPIEKAIADPAFSSEARSRLKKVLEENTTPQDLEKFRLAASAKLTEDANYLVWLWQNRKTKGKSSELNEEVPKPNDWEDVIHARLVELSENDFGNNPAEWPRSLARSKQSQTENMPEKSLRDHLYDELGPLEATSGTLGKLWRFTPSGTDLVINQEHWELPFQGKTILESNRDVLKLLEERNLPADWYQPGGTYTLESSDSPQLLFQQMKSVIQDDEPQQNRMRHALQFPAGARQIHSLNRELDSSLAFTRLEFHAPQGSEFPDVLHQNVGQRRVPKKLEPKYVSFFFREKVAPFRSLQIKEKAGYLEIRIISESEDNMARLVQLPIIANRPKEKHRFRIELIHDGSLQIKSSANFAEFIRQYRQFFLTKFVPLLEPLEIEFELESVPTG